MPENVCTKCGTRMPAGQGCSKCLLTTGFGEDPESTAERIFQLALSYDEEERDTFIKNAAGDDESLLSDIRLLIDGYRKEGGDTADATLGIATSSRHDLARIQTEEPGTKIDHFRLVRLIGEGGMGSVWEAQQTGSVRRTVALKVIKLGMDTREVVARFERERQTLASMKHSNIAQVFEAGATQMGRPYFAMEFVDGEPITDYCDRVELGIRARIQLFSDVCAAVQHAHQKGVIHRDLKPTNILVVDGQAKVIDFGVAKATRVEIIPGNELQTQHTQILGTPAYMSPEQAGGNEDIDTRSDIYSLGVLLYELLTGETPFEAKRISQASAAELERILKHEEATRPSLRINDAHQRLGITPSAVRGDLDWITMKCLAKDRADRYSTANALAADLGRHIRNEPVTAAAPTPLYHLLKWTARNRVAFAASLAVALSLLTGTLVSIWQASIASEEARNAEQARNKAERLLEFSRHEEGKALLTRAMALENEKKLFRAKLMAGRAIGFSGYGRDRVTSEVRDRLPALLQMDSAEASEARRLLNKSGDYALLWQSPVTAHHNGRITAVSYNPDGSQLATCSPHDQMIHIWDTETGARLRQFDMETSPWVVLFSPDGRSLAVGGETEEVRLIDPSTGDTQLTLSGSSGSVFRMWYSPEGSQLAATDNSGTILLWDAESGENLPVIGQPGAALFDFAFSKDGKWIATVGDDETFRVLDRKTGENLMTISELGNNPFTVTFSSDSKTLFGGLGTGQIESWDLETGEKMPRIFEDHSQAIYRLRLSPDGKNLASVSWDTRTRISRIMDGKELQLLEGHTTRVLDAVFHPTKNEMASVSNDNTLRLWNLNNGNPVFPVHGHSMNVECIAFSPDGRHIASSGDDRSIQIWDLRTGESSKIVSEHIRDIVGIDFAPSGRVLASVSVYGIVKLWDPLSGERLRTISIQHPGKNCSDLKFINETRIATAAEDGTVRIWNLSNSDQVHLLKAHSKSVTSIDVSMDGKLLVSGGRDRLVNLWDVATGERLATYSGHTNSVSSVRFFPTGGILASGDESGIIRFWSLRSGLLTDSMSACSNKINAIDFSPDGNKLAVADASGSVCVFGVGTGKLQAILEGHNGTLNAVAFSNDGSMIATASSDRSIALWEASGADRTILKAHQSNILAMDWGADHLVSADRRNINFWDSSQLQINDFAEEFENLTATCLAHQPKSGVLALGNEEGEIVILEAGSGTLIQRFLAHNDRVDAVQFSLDEDFLASVGQDGWLRIWNLGSQQLFKAVDLRTQGTRTDRSAYHLAFSSDGRRLFCGGETGGGIRSWRTSDYSASLTLQGHSLKTRSLHPHPSLPILASASADETIRLWDTTNLQLIKTLSAHSGEVYNVQFAPSGERFASASEDQTVIIWDTASRTPLEVFEGHAGIVRFVRFDRTGNRLASGGEDGTIRFWDLQGQDPKRYASDHLKFTTSGLHFKINRAAISDHLARAIPSPPMPIPDSTQIGVLRSQPSPQARSLFTRCLRSGNWRSALHQWHLLPDTHRDEERLQFCSTLSREALISQMSGRLDNAEMLVSMAEKIGATLPEVITARAIVALHLRGSSAEATAIPEEIIARIPSEAKLQRAQLLEADFHWNLKHAKLEEAQIDLESLVKNHLASVGSSNRFYEAYARSTCERLSTSLSQGDETAVNGLRSLALIEYLRQAISIAPFDDRFLKQLLSTLTQWDAMVNPALSLIDSDTEWSYLDGGTEPGAEWLYLQFPDYHWGSGTAPLGFGSKIETTTKLRRNASGLRTDPSWITFHFRHRFDTPDLGARKRLLLNCYFDDGIIVYLNGEEIGRRNMPEGAVSIDTPASVYQNEPGHYSYVLKSDRLKNENVIAAEIHQRESSSSDIYFALDLVAVGATDETYLASLDTSEIDESINWLATFLPPSLSQRWIPLLKFGLDDTPSQIPDTGISADLCWLVRARIQMARGQTETAEHAAAEAITSSAINDSILGVGVAEAAGKL